MTPEFSAALYAILLSGWATTTTMVMGWLAYQQWRTGRQVDDLARLVAQVRNQRRR